MGAGSSYGGSNRPLTRGGKLIKEKQIKNIVEKDSLLKELIKKGVKLSIKDVVFTVKDSSGQILWLENGNEKSGLMHIKKHKHDFVAKHRIQSKHLISHIKNILCKGEILSSKYIVLDNGKIGIEKIYLYKEKYYAIGAIGTNGYVVSMYPIEGGK